MTADVLGDQFNQLRDHVAQLVNLTLSRNMTRDAARVLDVLVPVKYFPDGLWLRSNRVPHVHRENQGVATRVVVEDCLGRRVGENSAVPLEVAIDANGWKGRRQRA